MSLANRARRPPLYRFALLTARLMVDRVFGSRPGDQILRKIFRRYIQNRINQKTISTPSPRSTGSNG